MLHPGPDAGQSVPLNPSSEEDAEVMSQLSEMLGDEFAPRIYGDAAWARAILHAEKEA